MGSRQRWFFNCSVASKTAPRNVKDLPIDREIRAQHPPRSDFANRARKYLKYKCSKSNKSAANRIPAISNKKADKNCSKANGSDDLCSCLPGLHVPVIQYRLNRSKSPLALNSKSRLLNISTYLEFLLKANPYPVIAYHCPTVNKRQSSSCCTK
uniref:Ionotropic receptor 20 n=1 Tax=Propsilocerus akamusi TaxID=903466 RepID=A0A7D0TEA8_9DIPT|nr:ionotropic receptor 20 [Propsilocerus akamusi]